MVMQRVERAFRPGQVARARLTITNDGNIPMRYALEVSPGVTAPLVGFVAEETSVLVTDLVQPGRSATVRVPLSLPPEVAEGRKVVRVRIGEAGPEGDLLDILDEQFFSGLLRVEVPRPEQPPVPTPPTPPAPTPPPPVEAMPLPGEIPRVRGRIVSVESPQRGQALQGGQRVAVRATYENTGAEPHAFSVIAWAGEITGPGQIDPDVQGAARGPTVNPGARNTLEVSLSLPEQPPLGFASKDALVMLVDFDPTGRFPVAIHDSRGLPNLFTLAAPPTPPEVVTPVPGEIVPPRPLAFGDIRIDRVTASPTTAGPGDLVIFTVPFANLSPVPAPLRIEPAIIDRTGTSVVDIAPATVDLPVGRREPGLAFRITLPAGIQPGSYGLGVDILDHTTNVLLAQRDFPGLFSVAAPVLPAPAGLLPGDLDLLDPGAEPDVINPGQMVQVQLPFFNAGPVAPPVTADVFILGPQGAAVASLPRLTFSPELGVATLRTVRWTVPQAAQPGSYGVQVFAWDPNTFVPGDPSTYLIREQVLDVFTAEALPVEVTPPPTPPQVPAPVTPRGLVPGDLDLLDPIATPEVARPGQTVQLDLPFMNAGPVSPPVTASVFILGPQGTAIADLPQMTFSPGVGAATLRTVRWTVPQTAAPGSYGVQVYAWDPNTFVAGDPSTYLIREQVLDVFTVEAIPVEVAPPQLAQPPVETVPPGPPVPSPGDLGQPTIQFSPSTVEMGQVTQGSVAIPNLADFPFTARVTASLIDSAGSGIQTVVAPTDLAFNPLGSRGAGFTLNTAGLEPDTYGVRVVAVDAFTGTTLMDQNIPGGLQVTIPAALRGVNEFSNIRWFYGAEEPPAPSPSLPIIKSTGDPTGGFVLLRHRGEGGHFNIGYGTAAAQVFGHGDPFRFYIAQEEVPPHLVTTDMVVRIPQGPWPSVSLAPPGRYDALKFIDNADTRESVHQNWDEDVFQVSG